MQQLRHWRSGRLGIVSARVARLAMTVWGQTMPLRGTRRRRRLPPPAVIARPPPAAVAIRHKRPKRYVSEGVHSVRAIGDGLPLDVGSPSRTTLPQRFDHGRPVRESRTVLESRLDGRNMSGGAAVRPSRGQGDDIVYPARARCARLQANTNSRTRPWSTSS